MTAASDVQRDRVVGVRRRIQASRTFLFKAWTDPIQFVRWFGPKTWTVERCAIDARPGGTWRTWLKRSDGASISVGGVYTDVEPDRRLVFTWDDDNHGRPSKTLSIVTVEFLDYPEGVEVCVTHRELTTGQAVDMDVGWNSTLDSLLEYVMTLEEHNPLSPIKEEAR
jgi:uncharacterized protein YndB with AHSA1/START domain